MGVGVGVRVAGEGWWGRCVGSGRGAVELVE